MGRVGREEEREELWGALYRKCVEKKIRCCGFKRGATAIGAALLAIVE